MKLKKEQMFFGIIRISLGWIFLWPFLDKLFGLGFTTPKESAWIFGGSPTNGFLLFATKGPFAAIFQGMANYSFVDWFFMIGLLLIGLALILGVSTRIAAYSGTAMLILMWLAVLPPEHNPFMDEHIIYSLTLLALVYLKAGNYLGLGEKWRKTKLVKNYPILQ